MSERNHAIELLEAARKLAREYARRRREIMLDDRYSLDYKHQQIEKLDAEQVPAIRGRLDGVTAYYEQERARLREQAQHVNDSDYGRLLYEALTVWQETQGKHIDDVRDMLKEAVQSQNLPRAREIVRLRGTELRRLRGGPELIEQTLTPQEREARARLAELESEAGAAAQQVAELSYALDNLLSSEPARVDMAEAMLGVQSD